MRFRHPIAQVAVMTVASLLIAVIANGFAGRTRRLMLPGWYPNALRVPPRAAETPATTSASATVETTTTAQSPLPGQPPMVIPSTTIATATQTTVDPVAPQPDIEQSGNSATQQPATAAPIAPAAKMAPATKAADLAKFTPHPDKAYVEISGDDAASLHAAGVLFLDARRSSVYEEGHIAGSRSFSVWESDIDDKVAALYEERPDPADQNKPIVIYCSGGACEDSHMLAQKLWGLQFNNVYVYKDGFPDWQRRTLPVRTGATP